MIVDRRRSGLRPWGLAKLVALIAMSIIEHAAAEAAASDRSISTSALAHLLTSPQAVVLLDVRERPEFAVSRIPQALHVAPSTEVSILAARLSRLVAGRTVVMYCTVGRRSADLATFAEEELKRLGARAVYVLEGGIVAWHNERRALISGRGRTEALHPFNEDAIRLIMRKDLAPLPK
jgi:rhodanese-related sulfurtransferase